MKKYILIYTTAFALYTSLFALTKIETKDKNNQQNQKLKKDLKNNASYTNQLLKPELAYNFQNTDLS